MLPCLDTYSCKHFLWQAENLNTVKKWIPGLAKCPYDPDDSATALMTREGDFYSATVMDITARDPAIYRIMGPSRHLRTVRNSKWLNGKSVSFSAQRTRYSIVRQFYLFYLTIKLSLDKDLFLNFPMGPWNPSIVSRFIFEIVFIISRLRVALDTLELRKKNITCSYSYRREPMFVGELLVTLYWLLRVTSDIHL